MHATRNALGLVMKGAQGMVASAIRSIFEQPDEASARAQLRRVADGLRPRFERVAELLEGAEDDLLAHFTFPAAHRRQIRSTNPQERLNKEIRRRTDVVRHLPQPGQPAAPGRHAARRAGRRVGGRAQLLQR